MFGSNPTPWPDVTGNPNFARIPSGNPSIHNSRGVRTTLHVNGQNNPNFARIPSGNPSIHNSHGVRTTLLVNGNRSGYTPQNVSHTTSYAYNEYSISPNPFGYYQNNYYGNHWEDPYVSYKSHRYKPFRGSFHIDGPLASFLAICKLISIFAICFFALFLH